MLEAPKTRRSAASRARLLEAAAELFLERSYSAVSMADVAARAKLTKPGVYGHVRSKGQLLVEVIRWKLAEREGSRDFADALGNQARAFTMLWSADGRDVRLLMTEAAAVARHDPDVAAGLAELDEQRRAAIALRVAGSVDDPKLAAWVLITLAAGIGAKEAIGVPPPDDEQAKALLEGLGRAFRSSEVS